MSFSSFKISSHMPGLTPTIKINAFHDPKLHFRTSFSKFSKVEMNYLKLDSIQKNFHRETKPTKSIQKPIQDRFLSIYSSEYQQKTTFRRVPIFNSISSSSMSSPKLLFLALIPAVIASQIEETSSDEQTQRIDLLLSKKAADRKLEERIELFNFLVAKGEEEAVKAKGKDVVILFGETGAGKSALINYLCGCTMKKEGGDIMVDPNSKVPQVATISSEISSCTFIPKSIPNVKVFTEELFGEQGEQILKDTFLTFFDMPGQSDNRGIEVALASAIVMRLVAKNAKSVRLVMVSERGLISVEKGDFWREEMKLLEDRFNINFKNGNKNLSLMVTKTPEDIDSVKQEIVRKTGENSGLLDLSGNAMVYDPLDSKNRKQILEKIFYTKAQPHLQVEISVRNNQLWEAFELGKSIHEKVAANLASEDLEGIHKSLKMVKFTYKIATLNRSDLSSNLAEAHEKVAIAINEHVTKVLHRIEPRNNLGLLNQCKEFKKYVILKENFGPYTSFQASDRQVRSMVSHTKDDRWCSWEKPNATIGGCAATVGAVVGGVLFTGAFFAVPFVSIPFACVAGLKWAFPSEEDVEKGAFFKGP